MQGVSEFLSALSRSVPHCYSLSLIKLYPVVPREIVGPKRLGPDYFLDLTPQSSAEEMRYWLRLVSTFDVLIDNCLDRIRYVAVIAYETRQTIEGPAAAEDRA